MMLYGIVDKYLPIELVNRSLNFSCITEEEFWQFGWTIIKINFLSKAGYLEQPFDYLTL
jgi:hypothetical protein